MRFYEQGLTSEQNGDKSRDVMWSESRIIEHQLRSRIMFDGMMLFVLENLEYRRFRTELGT